MQCLFYFYFIFLPMKHAMTSPVKHNSMGDNVTTSRQATRCRLSAWADHPKWNSIFIEPDWNLYKTDCFFEFLLYIST